LVNGNWAAGNARNGSVLELLWIFLRELSGFLTFLGLLHLTSFDLLYGVEKLGIFWRLNRHDKIFMRFSFEIIFEYIPSCIQNFSTWALPSWPRTSK
jgi:hypothetical protein